MSAPMSWLSAAILLRLFIGLAGVLGDDEFEGSRTLTLEHSFDLGPNPLFTKRGTVVVRSVKGNKAHMSHNAPLTDEDLDKLEELVEKNDIYRLRIPVRSPAQGEEDYVTTYTLACSVYESNLSDHIWIHFDQSGEVLGVSMETYPAYCGGGKRHRSFLNNWNTTVDISQTVVGPMPDTQSYIDKLKRDEQEKAKGQQGDNRSFLAKYWMYIVPVVLVMMLSGGQEAQGGGGGGGGGGR